MNIGAMLHAMYFSGNTETVTKINHVPYQTVQYDEKGMFPAQQQCLPVSHLVLITNTQYYKNIQRQKAQLSPIFGWNYH